MLLSKLVAECLAAFVAHGDLDVIVTDVTSHRAFAADDVTVETFDGETVFVVFGAGE